MAPIIATSQESKSYIDVALHEDPFFKVPVYPGNEVRPLECSKYVRLAAKDLFDKHFIPAHAWNRPYIDRTVASLKGGKTLKKLVGKGVLRQGMIVGIHNPGSEFLAYEDQRGNPIEFTHVGLYIGRNLSGQPLLAEKFEEKTLVRTEQELRNAHLTPFYIFDTH